MAKHAHSTPTPIPHVTTGTPRRRALFAAASAIAIGTGVTAGAAASVADFVPPEPDADLVEACTQFSSIELRCNAIDNAARTLEEEDRADVLVTQLRGTTEEEHHWPALNRICTTPGSTYAGAVALASALAVWKAGAVIAPADNSKDYVSDRITAALLRCLLGGA